MVTVVIGVLLAACLTIALRGAAKHFRGEGGCCGGGDEPLPEKRLEAPVAGRKIVSIEGMHCESCARRVTFLLNGIEGAAARVELARKRAVVSFTRPVGDEEIRAALADSGYEIAAIRQEGAA